MASYYPEGDCFFQRSSLRYPSGWAADNSGPFYSHVLLEYCWNWWVTKQTQPQNFTHPRARLVTGKAAWPTWNTLFGVWDRFHVAETSLRNLGASAQRTLAMSSHANSQNFNECRDVDKGGPYKYILRPVQITNKDTEWLWIDATIPLRAIYFPVSHKTDEALPDYCTYVVIDFRARESVDIRSIRGTGGFTTYKCTREHGLGYRRDVTWGFNVPNIITYLTLPRQVRNPEQGLYRTAVAGDELVVTAPADSSWLGTWSNHPDFHPEMDLAKILSATFGVEVGWRPYKYSSFILDLLQSLTSLALGFVPGIGPLLSVGFGLAMQAIADPGFFGSDNILELNKATLEILIRSATRGRKYMAPDVLPTSYKPIDPNVLLTEEERKARKEAGEAFNAHLTELLHRMRKEGLPQSQAWLDRIADSARPTTPALEMGIGAEDQDSAVEGQDLAAEGQDLATEGQDSAAEGQDLAAEGQKST